MKKDSSKCSGARNGQKFRASGIATLSENTGFKDYSTWGIQSAFYMWLGKSCA